MGEEVVRVAVATGLALGVAAIGAAGGLLAIGPDPAAASAEVTLFDDDGGVALFGGAVPFRTDERRSACVEVGADGATGQGQVMLAADSVSGALADHLLLSIEVGNGGHVGDCSGFAGETVWEGTLTELAASVSLGGVATGWRPSSPERMSFRFVAGLDGHPSAAGTSATADLVWFLEEWDGPDLPLVEPTPTSGGTVADSPSSLDGLPLEEPPPSSSSLPPGPESSATTVTTGSLPDGVPGRPPDVELVPRTRAEEALEVVALVIRQTARVAPYPVGLLVLAGLFALVQQRLDGRDPKLSGAVRTRRDNELLFPDIFDSTWVAATGDEG